MGINRCSCCELFQEIFPPGAFARIWVRKYVEGDTGSEPELGLDGSGVFVVVKWGCDCVHLTLQDPSNSGVAIRQLVVKCEDIVTMRRRL
jgi:hypothetical protein